MDVALGINGCGSTKIGKTVVARIVEEWRRNVLGLGIGGGRRPQRRWLKVKMVLVAAKC